MKFVSTILFFSTLICSAAAQTTWFVDNSAAAGSSGDSWANAFNDLHQALSTAQSGDAIWVKTGKYLPDNGTDRNRSFVLKSGVKLYGSFAGGETTINQRNIGEHPTILSGNIGSLMDSTDNSYTILYMAYVNANTRIDGFTLEQGYAVSDTCFNSISPCLSGAAVYIYAGDSLALPVFDHCIFKNNVAAGYGGAILALGQVPKAGGNTPIFRFCTFSNNSAGLHGGALAMQGGCVEDRGVEFDHCIYDHNRSSDQGGGIYLYKTIGRDILNFNNCTIRNNVGQRISGFLAYGSAYVPQRGVVMDSCDINGNSSINTGAAVLGFQTFSSSPISVKILHSHIHDNFSTPPSSSLDLPYGLFWTQMDNDDATDTLIVSGNLFENNKTAYLGSFVSKQGMALCENNIIRNNKNQYDPPSSMLTNSYGLVLAAKKAYSRNNICVNNELPPLLITGYTTKEQYNNTFVNNAMDIPISFQEGSPKYFQDTFYTSNEIYINNRFYDNHAININDYYKKMIAFNNIYQNNLNVFDSTISIPNVHLTIDSVTFLHTIMDIDPTALYARTVFGNGNIFTNNPMFRDTAAGDYRLQPCSPGIDAGTNIPVNLLHIVTDVAGQPRILGGTVDIGAYEAQVISLAQNPFIKAACEGQNNGAVNFDLADACLPLNISWSNATGSGMGNADLAPGIYSFYITDQKNHSVQTTVQIPVIISPDITAQIQKASSPTAADGAIAVSVISGTLPFQFMWSNGELTPTINNLTVGTYSLQIKDGADCIYTFIYNVDAINNSSEPLIEKPSIQPNPANEAIFINFGQSTAWRMYSADGRLIQLLSDNNGQVILNLNGLPTGLYYYQFLFPNGTLQEGKLTIIH